jgi:hypothetical protein
VSGKGTADGVGGIGVSGEGGDGVSGGVGSGMGGEGATM